MLIIQIQKKFLKEKMGIVKYIIAKIMMSLCGKNAKLKQLIKVMLN